MEQEVRCSTEYSSNGYWQSFNANPAVLLSLLLLLFFYYPPERVEQLYFSTTILETLVEGEERGDALYSTTSYYYSILYYQSREQSSNLQSTLLLSTLLRVASQLVVERSKFTPRVELLLITNTVLYCFREQITRRIKMLVWLLSSRVASQQSVFVSPLEYYMYYSE